MSAEGEWLHVVIAKIQADLQELKGDVKILLEEKAEKKGKQYVIVGFITIALNILAIWLKTKGDLL